MRVLCHESNNNKFRIINFATNKNGIWLLIQLYTTFWEKNLHMIARKQRKQQFDNGQQMEKPVVE